MSTKIVKEIDSEKLLSGDEVTLEIINELSKNLFKKVRIKEGLVSRDMDCSNPPPHTNIKKRDTRTIHFKKEKIEALFTANDKPGNPCDGLLIVLGLHDNAIYETGKPEYDSKLMVVLATMTGEVINLEENDFVTIAGGPFPAETGMDNGKLCPPDRTCKV